MDRFATADFDLVLMDVRMPRMDGLTATRSMRAIERERGSPSIPIIAMTANASAKDIEISGAAGCNAHFSKPISKYALLSLIEEYCPRLKPPEPPTTGPLHPIMIEIPPCFETLTPNYLAGYRDKLAPMITLLASSDFNALADIGHNMKGSGAPYGFPELARLGDAMEDSARQMDAEALSAELAELRKYLGQVELVAKV